MICKRRARNKIQKRINSTNVRIIELDKIQRGNVLTNLFLIFMPFGIFNLDKGRKLTPEEKFEEGMLGRYISRLEKIKFKYTKP